MPRITMKNGKFNSVMLLACSTLGLSVICIVIAFTTPYWLVSDGSAPVEKFQRLGLWEACFKGFVDIYYRYDREFKGCKWIFDEDYNFIRSFLSPSFFVAVQVLFTLGLVSLILACLVLMVFTMCLVSDKEDLILKLLASLVSIAGYFVMEYKYKPLRILELYSGIGGMRYAIELTGVSHEVVAAVDVNPVVNIIYQHNFGSSSHLQRNIQSFTPQDLDRMELDVITMSPPCQPFTRVGLKKDFEDARTCSFLHILNVITELKHKPEYLLLENVKGFEDSHTHDILIETLKKCGYSFQEFLLSPSNLGFPNSRLRYYIIAILEPSKFPFEVNDKLLCDIPMSKIDWKNVCKKCQNEKLPECQVKHFLEDKPDTYFEDFLVPDNILLKYAKVFDIVYENSSHSCCFTKAYGRYSLGTGSVFTTCCPSEVSSVYIEFEKTQCLELFKSLRLRYFTPREVANLMCFPNSFSIPPNISPKQMYKALGNSVNVFVISSLMTLLFKNELQNR